MNVHARSVRPAASLVVAALTIGAVIGCNATAPSPVATQTGPRPTPVELEISVSAAPAGEYALPGFDPPITVELDGSWQSVIAQAGSVSLTQISRPLVSNPYAAGTIVSILQVNEVASGADAMTKASTPRDAADALRIALGDMFIQASDATIGGRAAAQVVVERPGDGPAMSRDVVEIFSSNAGSIVLSPGDRHRITVVQSGGGIVAFVINSSIKTWDAELAAAEPLLASIHFEAP